MTFLILVAIFLLIMYFCYKRMQDEEPDDKGEANGKTGIGSCAVPAAVEFFDGYLSLCKAHRIQGTAGLHQESADTSSIQLTMSANVITIDGEHANDAIEVLLITRDLVKKDYSVKDYAAYSAAADSVILNYFGTNHLHYAYTDPEDYGYDGCEVIFKAQTTLFPTMGEKLQPTLREIERQLLEKWPNVSVQVGRYGMTVRA